MKRKTEPDFEANLKNLEQLVERLERGELTLEESLQQFEQGMQLVRSCQQALATAEQRVRVLSQDSQGETLAEFPDPDSASAVEDTDDEDGF